MMKMRKFFYVIVSLLLVFSLPSCNLAYWFEEIPSDDERFVLDKLTVNGENIDKYTIVYQTCPTDAKRWTGYYYGTEYDPGLVCAQTLQKTLLDVCGVNLPLSDSFDPEDPGKVILVGFTAGVYPNKTLSYNENYVAVVGDTLLLCGGSDAANYQSISLFFNELRKLSGKKSAVQLEDGFEVRETCDVVRVACLGDSLTFGVGSDQPKYLSYPAYLERLSWRFAVVDSYALPEACVLPDADFQLSTSGAYEECLSNADNYDYLILLIGTYDSNHVWKNEKEWNFTNDSDFLVAYLDAVEKYLEKNADCTVFVVNSPVVSTMAANEGYASDAVRVLQRRAYETLLAKDNNVHFVDLYSATAERITQYLRNDGVTFTNAGYYVIAEHLYSELVHYMDNLEEENAPST